jgi:VIT1/CCC1 family predicted Fe2+/Mn2+ transporter
MLSEERFLHVILFRMLNIPRSRFLLVFHEIVFGIEDSLVSTVGLLSGVAASGVETKTIILTGLILIFVEAFSMGMGSILADNSTKEVAEHKEVPLQDSVLAGSSMFFSYIVAGLVPWSPYLLLERDSAFTVSIVASIAALFLLGAVQGRIARINILKQGVQMAALGGLAIALGVTVGRLLS